MKQPKTFKAEPPPEPDAADVPAADAAEPRTTRVKWTDLGEERGAHSEHGKHTSGEIVETEHAEILIENGFAEPA